MQDAYNHELTGYRLAISKTLFEWYNHPTDEQRRNYEVNFIQREIVNNVVKSIQDAGFIIMSEDKYRKMSDRIKKLEGRALFGPHPLMGDDR